MTKIAALANLHLLPEAQEQVTQLSAAPAIFPDEDGQPSEQTMIERTGDVEMVLVSSGTKVTASYLDACPSVKYIGICGTSKENVDVAAAEGRGITVTNVVDYGDEPATEFIFMQLEYLARGMGEYQWRDYPTELMGKTIGIIGLGALGGAIAHLALAYKMNVLYYSRTRKSDQEQLGIKYVEKDELLQSSQIIVVSTPSNLIALSKDDFNLLQPNSIVVQASQGVSLSREGFLEWVTHDGNFALFDYSAGQESYEAYKDVPRVIFPKIIAGHTQETKRRLGEKVVFNVKQFLGRDN